MEDKQNYIRMLKQKRDTELPEIIKELQLKLEMRKKEKVDIDFEIQHLTASEIEKTIFDLPDVAWRKIANMLTIQLQNEIHSLSLSSAKMTHFLDTIFPKSSELIKMEKAFSVLVTNFYLDRDDLLNCTETSLAVLGKIASRTWHFLENPNYQSVDGIGIQDFRENFEGQKNEHKLWTCFAGKIVEFNMRGRPLASWNKAKDFLQEFGQFVGNIELQLDNIDLETAGMADYIHKMLLDGKLPNLQFFSVYAPCPTYGLCPQSETRSLQHHFCLWTCMPCYSVENYKALLKLPALIAESWYNNESRCVISFKKLKCLIYHVLYVDDTLRKKVIAAQNNGLFQTKELDLNPYTDLGGNLAEKFPALTKISLQIPSNRDLIVPRNIRIPTVRTLAYCFYGVGTFPRLRDLFAVFPSMRRFIIKTNLTRDEFVAYIKRVVEWEENNVDVNDAAAIGFEDFDICQRISNEQTLTESNIWAQVPKLKVLTLITGKLLFHNAMKSAMVEKYTRGFGDRESTHVEKYTETVATQFPSYPYA